MVEDCDFLDDIMGGGVPSSVPPYQLGPIERRWDRPFVAAAPLRIARSPDLFDDVLPGFTERFVVRRTRSATYGWQGKFPSAKMGRTLMARSHLELRLMELCEVDGGVRRFVEQPIQLHYEDAEGKARRHIPDLFVHRSAGGEFIEVKWERDARASKNEARWPHIAAAVTSLGYSYTVMTERHIMAQPLAANVGKLLRHRNSPPPARPSAAAIWNALFPGALKLDDLLANLPEVSSASVFRALADGWLSTDLMQPLGPASWIRLSAGGLRAR